MFHAHMLSCILNGWSTLPAHRTKQEKEAADPASPVVAIGWSLNGRRVVTSEEKGRIRLWNVETGAVVYSCLLDSVSLTVQISPGDPNIVLACPNAGKCSRGIRALL